MAAPWHGAAVVRRGRVPVATGAMTRMMSSSGAWIAAGGIGYGFDEDFLLPGAGAAGAVVRAEMQTAVDAKEEVIGCRIAG